MQELDHVIAAVFGLWDFVIPEHRLYVPGRVVKGLRKPRAAPGARVDAPEVEETG